MVAGSNPATLTINDDDDDKRCNMGQHTKPLFEELEETDIFTEWQGMPEFVQEDLTPYRVINVRFRNQEDVEAFAKLMGQDISPKQKTLWYPKAEFRRAAHLRYVDES